MKVVIALREVFKDQVLLRYNLKYAKICKESNFYDICFFDLHLHIYIYSSYIYPYSSSSEHPIWDFAQEHAIVLHFETKNKDLLSNYVFSKTVSAVILND